jgi:hypothetical protein
MFLLEDFYFEMRHLNARDFSTCNTTDQSLYSLAFFTTLKLAPLLGELKDFSQNGFIFSRTYNRKLSFILFTETKLLHGDVLLSDSSKHFSPHNNLGT